ncbi:MAG: polysaccharide deacetylase family protein, partial [Caldilineaceae bacterium]
SPDIEGIRRTGRLVLPRYADADTNDQSDDGVEADAIEDSVDSALLAASIAQERDLVFDFFWLVTGGAEARTGTAAVADDPHGNLLLARSDAPQRSLWLEAGASTIVEWLEAQGRRLGWPPPRARWPHGNRAAAAVGHDVDYPEVIRWLEPARVLARQGLASRGAAWQVAVGKRHHWHFADWMDVEEAMGVRSAFYFVARKGSLVEYARGVPDPFYDITSPRFRALFAQMQARSFEIGLHASYLAHESVNRLHAERTRLGDAAGAEIIGNRHHYWRLQRAAPDDTLLLHEEAGLFYDTSMTNDRYLGWRRGLCTPYSPFHVGARRPIGTLQIGTAWM